MPILRGKKKSLSFSEVIFGNLNSLSFWKNVTVLLLLILIVYCYVTVYNFRNTKHSSERTKLKAPASRCSYAKLLSDYPNQAPSVWPHLKEKLEKAITGGHKCGDYNVYLFVENESLPISHNEDANNTITEYDGRDRIDDILEHFEQCIGREIPVTNLNLDIFTSERSLEDYGHVVRRFRKTRKEGNVIRITKLNEIPHETARALHAICDSYDPMFDEPTVILLRLAMPPIHGHFITKVTDYLYNLWKEAGSLNILDPLISRVSEVAINLQN